MQQSLHVELVLDPAQRAYLRQLVGVHNGPVTHARVTMRVAVVTARSDNLRTKLFVEARRGFKRGDISVAVLNHKVDNGSGWRGRSTN